MDVITREINITFSTLINFLIISIIAICLFVYICPFIYHLEKHGEFVHYTVALEVLPYTQLCEVVNKTNKPLMPLFSCLQLMLFSEHVKCLEFVSMKSNPQTNNGHYDVICVLLKITALLHWLSCPLSGFSVCLVLSPPPLRSVLALLLAKHSSLSHSYPSLLFVEFGIRATSHCSLCHLNMSV